MAHKSVLIIEDDLDIRENLTEILTSEGYDVLAAENGRAGIEVLINGRNSLPGCIILDLSMPVMDGVTFTKTLYENFGEDLTRIPIIVATAKGSALAPSVLSLPVEYMQKPVDLEELLSIVERHCGEGV